MPSEKENMGKHWSALNLSYGAKMGKEVKKDLNQARRKK